MTIYLTEPKDLTAGLWWARQITGEQDLGRGPWLIVELTGDAPFLSLGIVYVSGNNEGLYSKDSRYPDTVSVSAWEFGPQIDMPSDKDSVEQADAYAQVLDEHEATLARARVRRGSAPGLLVGEEGV